MYNKINKNKLDFDINFDTDEINEFDNGNDFELVLANDFNEINNLLRFIRDLPNVIFSRLTGTGSCIFAAFESENEAENSLAIFKKKYPNLWVKIVENNFSLRNIK